MTEVNLYLENTNNTLATYQFNESVTNIDTARELLFRYLDPFYLQGKYKVVVKDRFTHYKIDVIFEKNTELNREFLLKEILKND